MKKEIRQSLLKQASKAIIDNFPDFHLYREKSIYIFPGEMVWENQNLLSCATIYIILSPNPKGYDSFTIEIGWSRLRRFPQLPARPNVVGNECESALSLTEVVFRLSALCDFPEWISVTMDHIPQAVDHAINAINQFGIPYLKRIPQTSQL